MPLELYSTPFFCTVQGASIADRRPHGPKIGPTQGKRGASHACTIKVMIRRGQYQRQWASFNIPHISNLEEDILLKCLYQTRMKINLSMQDIILSLRYEEFPDSELPYLVN